VAQWRIWNAKSRGSLVAAALSQAWRTPPPPFSLSPPELNLISPVLLDSPAAALVWTKLRNATPKQAIAERFHDAYRVSALQSEIRAMDLQQVLARVRSVNVEPIVHKGWATARLYPEPGVRAYSDIDLLIRPDQQELAQAALQTPPSIQCAVDLLHSEITQLDSASWEALYARSHLVKLGSTDIRILGAEDHLRGLCIHCMKHGVASPLWLVDVAVTMERLPANFDWQLCVGSREPQANWIRCALSLAHRLLKAEITGTPVGEFVDQLPGWLTRSVLRRWSRPPVPDQLPRFAAVLKGRRGILEALAWRWPSAGQTTVDANARFSRVPNIHLQLQSFFAPGNLKAFVSELPMVWRETRKRSFGTEKSQR